MSTNARSSEKRTDPRPAYLYLGEDADGGAHYFETAANRVHVALPDGRERVQLLGERPIDDWMAYVADRRGWAERYYGGWPVVLDHLEDALEA